MIDLALILGIVAWIGGIYLLIKVQDLEYEISRLRSLHRMGQEWRNLQEKNDDWNIRIFRTFKNN